MMQFPGWGPFQVEFVHTPVCPEHFPVFQVSFFRASANDRRVEGVGVPKGRRVADVSRIGLSSVSQQSRSMGNKQYYATPYGAYGPKVPKTGGVVKPTYPAREGLVPVGNLGQGYGQAAER